VPPQRTAAAPAPLTTSAPMMRLPGTASATSVRAAGAPPEHFFDVDGFGQAKPGQQGRRVAAFLERKVPADQYHGRDGLWRHRCGRLQPGGHSHRDDVLVTAGLTGAGRTARW